MRASYDYIIVGAGCAGLSLLMRLMNEADFASKRVLLIDGRSSKRNDRTWCFWENKAGYFEDLVYRKWKNLSFVDTGKHIVLDLGSYDYKMIRGGDFYAWCFDRIREYSNIDWWQEQLEDVTNDGSAYTFRFSDRTVSLEADYVFSSVLFEKKIQKVSSLLQHFKGWVIETSSVQFDPAKAILMDFSVDQQGLPAVFVYVLPLSTTQALVEYTVFSEETFPEEAYDQALSLYITDKLKLKDYTIVHEEQGIIPMTLGGFPKYNDGIHYIGTAGGQTKASTGYTFQFIQKQAATIVAALNGNKPLKGNQMFSRFNYYDYIMLQVLLKKQMKGRDIFKRLFERLPAALIFRFLDNETSIKEEIKIMNSMPSRIFLPAAIRGIFRLLKSH